MQGCRFCRENGLLADEPLAEGRAFYVLGMIDPTRKHGVMIVLNRHAETPFDITAQEWAELPEMLAFAKSYLAQFVPQAFTIGWNVGAVAGQTVDHVHLHVVCRFEGGPEEGHGINGLLKAKSQV